MLILENIRIAFSGLWANKMRALLTMLGIIIGISSVIIIVTIGNSMSLGMQEEMQSMGASNLQVYLQAKQEKDENGNAKMMMWVEPNKSDHITQDMIDKYKEKFSDNVQYISLSENVSANKAKKGTTTASIQTLGVNDEYFLANNIELLTGRLLTAKDNQNTKKICVVSDTLVNSLFAGVDPIGQEIELNINDSFHTYYIVGVYKQEDQMSNFSMDGTQSSSVYIPLSTAQKINSSDGFQQIIVTGALGVDSTTFATETEDFFAKLYQKNDKFTVVAFSMQGMVDSMTKMMGTLSLAISVIAGISLLVGGIGVMNIMLVSITERTKEIGTRKALGATNASIMLQFIVESIVICLAGGAIGVVIGVSVGSIGSTALGYTAQPSIAIIAIAVAFSMLIGVFFGYYPARKAAKLNPIDALRYE